MNYKFSILFMLATVAFISCSKKQQNLISSDSNSEILLANYKSEIIDYQKKLNADYLDPENSPLSKSQMKDFKESGGHAFFPINSEFRIIANFDTINLIKNLNFETTTDRIAVYDHYGTARFKLGSKNYALKIYQSHRLRVMEEYKDHLFLPFNDLTNGEETYGGGRYIDLSIPEGNTIEIDFNKTYNPYCAYSSKYSCPIPPVENYIEYEIKAGIKNPKGH